MRQVAAPELAIGQHGVKHDLRLAPVHPAAALRQPIGKREAADARALQDGDGRLRAVHRDRDLRIQPVAVIGRGERFHDGTTPHQRAIQRRQLRPQHAHAPCFLLRRQARNGDGDPPGVERRRHAEHHHAGLAIEVVRLGVEEQRRVTIMGEFAVEPLDRKHVPGAAGRLAVIVVVAPVRERGAVLLQAEIRVEQRIPPGVFELIGVVLRPVGVREDQPVRPAQLFERDVQIGVQRLLRAGGQHEFPGSDVGIDSRGEAVADGQHGAIADLALRAGAR